MVLAAGDPDAVERARPALEAIGSRTVLAGAEVGQASALKLACNSWVALVNAGTAQALALAAGQGVDPQLFLEAIEGGAVDTPYAHLKGAAMLSGDFSQVSFEVDGVRKDLGLMLEAANGADVLGRIAGGVAGLLRPGLGEGARERGHERRAHGVRWLRPGSGLSLDRSRAGTCVVAELIEIDDPADPRLGDYRDLRDVTLRKSLEAEHGLFIAEGEKVVRRARRGRLRAAFAADGAPLAGRALGRARTDRLPVLRRHRGAGRAGHRLPRPPRRAGIAAAPSARAARGGPRPGSHRGRARGRGRPHQRRCGVPQRGRAGRRRRTAGPSVRRSAVPALGEGGHGSRLRPALDAAAALGGRPTGTVDGGLDDGRAHPGGRTRSAWAKRSRAWIGSPWCSGARGTGSQRTGPAPPIDGPGSTWTTGWTPSTWRPRPRSPCTSPARAEADRSLV